MFMDICQRTTSSGSSFCVMNRVWVDHVFHRRHPHLHQNTPAHQPFPLHHPVDERSREAARALHPVVNWRKDDHPANALLEGRGPQAPRVATHRESRQGNIGQVEVIQNGASRLFPCMIERQTVLAQRSTLAGALECDDLVAVL
ncbi:MAG: hypothetical protein V9E89_03570 [Ilumatobacteraceae bacterium]